jgi:hypothetical protein
MEQRSKNRIRFIWGLFLFGFFVFGSTLIYVLSGIAPWDAFNLMVMVLGAFCIVMAIFLTKRNWY